MQTCTEDQCVECGCTAHSYADDTQVYVSTPATDHSDAIDRLTTCITRIRDLMASNRLKLNEEKTRIIWLGTCQQLDKVTVQALKLQNATVPFSSVVNDLGVLLDGQLTMANHVAALSRSCFFHLRRLKAIKQSLTSDATRTLMNAFVSSRLDSCNSLLAGVSSQLLQSGPECCRSSCHRSQKIRAYDACFTRSSLAAGSTADHI